MEKSRFIYQLATMRRSHKRFIMLLSDIIALPIALWSSYALRLSEWWPEPYLLASWWLFAVTPIIGVYVFARLGLYRAVVRFMGTQAIWAVVKGVSLLALFLWAVAFVFQIQAFPRSIPINFALVALVYVGGSRLLVRHYYHWFVRHRLEKDAVLIYGAGGAGIQLATALSDGREYYPVGFIDDDSSLWKSTIKGLPVYGIDSLEKVIEKKNVRHILLAVPNITNKERKKILECLSRYSVHIQTIPSMPDLLLGKALVEQLQEVEIEDLLGRDSVPPMPELMAKCITNKSVMITGAGGSIGSELCRQVLAKKPKILLLFEQSEFNLYQIEQELQFKKSEFQCDTVIVALLGSVVDRARVHNTLSHFIVDTIYHAAAYKHVPLVERNIIEGVTNNIFGTQVVAEEAARAHVSYFILISTDKAVRPTNVMGATKRFSELILQSLSMDSPTVFSMVRFGNVLGSSGSVVPLFRNQIKAGGPITVTHKEINRFFMTISEAASLVIQAGSMAKGGDVFVLDMGESVKIVDLAKRMVQLSGLELKTEENPEGDIEIKYTGLRPAEKLYEELLVGDNVIGTDHPKIMRANEEFFHADVIKRFLLKIKTACEAGDCSELTLILKEAVVGYRPHDLIVDPLSLAVVKSNVVKLV
ncbi:MAG: FlaA1/EpsC-like NDP-sugar epimerase [Enterobacterales bacterium]|jgi:FlaA1/EpsC-like NDP-sugar epimerase